MSDFEFHSRYGGPDAPLPDPETMCPGDCEGMGRVPIHRDDPDPIYKPLWEAAEREKPAEDGWHFVICPQCKGTGKRDPQS
jgi:hypothetical protein